MKLRIATIILGAAIWTGFFSLPVIQTGCQHQVTLAAGGAYSDPTAYTIDASIVQANQTILDLLQWYNTNKVFVDSKFPNAPQVAANVAANRKLWVKTAFDEEAAYLAAIKAYNEGSKISPDRAKVNLALSVLTSAINQLTAYKAAHP